MCRQTASVRLGAGGPDFDLVYEFMSAGCLGKQRGGAAEDGYSPVRIRGCAVNTCSKPPSKHE